jgi:hypothetical protein
MKVKSASEEKAVLRIEKAGILGDRNRPQQSAVEACVTVKGQIKQTRG